MYSNFSEQTSSVSKKHSNAANVYFSFNYGSRKTPLQLKVSASAVQYSFVEHKHVISKTFFAGNPVRKFSCILMSRPFYPEDEKLALRDEDNHRVFISNERLILFV